MNDLFILLGLAATIYGSFLIYEPVAWILAGVYMVLFGTSGIRKQHAEKQEGIPEFDS